MLRSLDLLVRDAPEGPDIALCLEPDDLVAELGGEDDAAAAGTETPSSRPLSTSPATSELVVNEL